jgi:RNA polymerase sigma-70 factor (ECF subfamily)
MEQEEDTKDLVQEVFITIWKRREDIDEKQSFNGYLFAITLNAIRKYFRKRVKDRKLVENWLNNTKSFSDDTNLMTEYRSLKERSEKIIEQLPPKRKKVFLLSREKGLRVEEIARKMNISKKTAENHLSLALRDIRNKLFKETFMMVLFFALFY